MFTATGHIIGATYGTGRRNYQVLGTATVWECAPEQATRIQWCDNQEIDWLQAICHDSLTAMSLAFHRGATPGCPGPRSQASPLDEISGSMSTSTRRAS